MTSHLKYLGQNLEIEFSNQFKHLPSEKFQQAFNPLVKNFKTHFPITLQEQPIDIREDGNRPSGFQ